MPGDWSAGIFFKKAQDALELSQYNVATYYYDVFTIRYPEEFALVIAAQYEKAFIEYKRGHYKAAEAAYRAILEKYDEPNILIPRFRELAEIGLINIEKDRFINKNLFDWRAREKKWAEQNGESLVDTQ